MVVIPQELIKNGLQAGRVLLQNTTLIVKANSSVNTLPLNNKTIKPL